VNVWEALGLGKRLLSQVSEEPELDAELFLRHSLALDRTSLYGRLPEEMSTEQEQRYRDLLVRRITHEPTAYILGHKEFFGLDFLITPAALIPRPETETLVELAIAFVRRHIAGKDPVIADVGTGCGAIAVSIAHTLPGARVIAIDSSRDALALAKQNAERTKLRARTRFLHGDLLEPLHKKVDLLLANLPYIPTEDWERLPPEIRDHEPRPSLDGGPDGLRFIERFLRQAPDHLQPRGAVFAEIGHQQEKSASGIAASAFPQAYVEVAPDLAGIPRVLTVRL
jgi:release factor glutamine methyltransferase